MPTDDAARRRLQTLELKVARLSADVASGGVTQSSLSGQLAELVASFAAVPWISPTYLSNWSDHSLGNQPGGYLRDVLGFVHVRGLVKRGTAGFGSGAPIFNLPVGYRPANTVSWWTWGGSTPKGTKVVVLTTGNVYVEASDSAAPEAILELTGLRFDPR